MAVKYQLFWSTDQGTSIKYRLNISNTDYVGPPIPIKCDQAASPVRIQYSLERNPYMPIRGSKAFINIVLGIGDSMEDLNEDPQYTWEVDVSYLDSEDVYQTYWRGWIEPLESSESLGHYPIKLSFTASDSLENLSAQTVDPYSNLQAKPIIEYFTDALLALGLGLDLYVDSKILISETSEDVIESLTVDERLFLDQDDLTRGDKLYDVLRRLLTSFNCSLEQSHGAWWIINNSLHGGTGDNEANTFRYWEFDPEGEDHFNDPVDKSVNLRYYIRRTATDLNVKDGSLALDTQPPYGSVEAKVIDLKPYNLIVNGDFSDGETGWSSWTDSLDQDLTISNTQSINGNAISTDRTRKKLNDTEDVWFHNTLFFDVNRDYPFEVKFDWTADIKENDVAEVELQYALVLQYTVTSSYTETNNYSATYGSTGSVTNFTTVRLQYDFNENNWRPLPGDTQFETDENWRTAATTTADSKWGSHAQTYEIAGKISNGVGNIPDASPNLRVYFFYPRGIKNNSKPEGNSTSDVTTYLDNIDVRNMYSSEYSPFFEKVQSSYATTLRYEPVVYGNSAAEIGFYNKLGVDTFRRGTKDVESASLEFLITQLKLNDYRTQFKTFQGTLINNNAVPLGLHNKIAVELDSFDELNDGYGSCVVTAGTFNLKSNEIEILMHSPNQATDITSNFFNRDVDLIGATAPDRSEFITYGLVIQPEGQDDEGNPIEGPDSEGRLPGDDGYVTTYSTLQPARFFIPFQGIKNTQITGRFELNPYTGYSIESGSIKQTDAAGLLPDDADYDDAAPQLTDLTFVDQGDTTLVEFNITLPRESITEVLYLIGVTDEQVGNNQTINFSSNTPANTEVSLVTSETGNVGQSGSVLLTVVPTNVTKRITRANSAVTFTVFEKDTSIPVSGVIDGDKIQEHVFGTGVQYLVPFIYNDKELDVAFTLTVVQTDIPGDTNTSTFTMTATEESDDTNFTINAEDADQSQTGVVASNFTFIFRLVADSGYVIPTGTISVASLEEDELDQSIALYSGGATAEVIITGVFPSTDSSAAITIDATPITIEEAINTFTHTITVPDAPANTSITSNSGATPIDLLEKQEFTFVVTQEGNAGYEIGDLTLTSSTGWIVLSDTVEYKDNATGIVEIKEYRFLVTGQGADSSATLAFGTGTASKVDGANMIVNINSTDAFNAQINKTQIVLPYSAADTGEAISAADWTAAGGDSFEVKSGDSQRVYSAATDASATSSDTDLITLTEVFEPDSKTGTFEYTLAGVYPSTVPQSKTNEVNITVSGQVTALGTAITAEWAMDTARIGTVVADTLKVGFVADGLVFIDDLPSWATGVASYSNTNGSVLFTITEALPANTKSRSQDIVLTGSDGGTAFDTLTLTQSTAVAASQPDAFTYTFTRGTGSGPMVYYWTDKDGQVRTDNTSDATTTECARETPAPGYHDNGDGNAPSKGQTCYSDPAGSTTDAETVTGNVVVIQAAAPVTNDPAGIYITTG